MSFLSSIIMKKWKENTIFCTSIKDIPVCAYWDAHRKEFIDGVMFPSSKKHSTLDALYGLLLSQMIDDQTIVLLDGGQEIIEGMRDIAQTYEDTYSKGTGQVWEIKVIPSKLTKWTVKKAIQKMFGGK